MIVAVIFTLIWHEGSRVLTFLFLGFWSRNRFEDLSQGGYMGIYAGELIETECILPVPLMSYRCCSIYGCRESE